MKETWETANGEVFCIKDMDDNHLLNTINLLERNCYKLARIEYNTYDLYDEPYCEKETFDYFEEYKAMCVERDRRGI